MWVGSVIFLLLLLAGYLFCLRKQEAWMQQLDKKEHNLYFLYPICNWLLTITGMDSRLRKKSEVTDAIKALYVTSKPEVLGKLFWCKRLSLVLAVLTLFNILSLAGFYMDRVNSALINGRYVQRPDYGKGSTDTELELTVENAGDVAENDGTLPKSQEVTIHVNERLYTEKEAEELFRKAKDYINQKVLGENQSAEEIRTSLNFISAIPRTSIKVKWYPEDYSLIKQDGSINNDEISEAGVTTSVKAILTYYECRSDVTLQFKIMPKQYSSNELFTKALTDAINSSSDRTSTDRLLELPETLGKYRISWEGTEKNSGVGLLLMGILLAVLLWIYGDKELEARMLKRKQQMLSDYPEIVNKFTLLVNAGMTLRQAWYKISEDYEAKASQQGFHRHYAYEEMLATMRELELGIPESKAYEQYGRRAGLIPYIKFSSLISQNLKKGTKGFTELLLHEAMDAFEERKETAKRLGEEAGTKLLIPMLIMLIMVFLIIMIPAFSAFSI